MTQIWIVLRGELTVSEGTNTYEKFKKDLSCPAHQISMHTRQCIQSAPNHIDWVQAFAAPAGSVESIRVLSGRKAHHSFQSAWHNVRMMSNWQPTPLLIFVSWREYTTSWLTHLVKVFHYLIMHHYLTLGSMEGKWSTWHLIEVPRNALAYLLQPENVESSTWTTLPSMNRS